MNKNAPPLIYALVQTKFSPIGKIEDSVADIQDKFRYMGFITFHSREIPVTTLNPQTGKVHQSIKKQWRFGDAENTANIIIENDQIILEVSKYNDHKDFFKLNNEIINIVYEHADITHITRLGLRYIDYITAPNKDELTKIINPSLLGFNFSGLDVNDTFNRTESISSNPEGKLIVKSFFDKRGQYLPPDLLPELMLNITPDDNKYMILDIDHFEEYKIPKAINEAFSIDDITHRYYELHKITSMTFKSCVTKPALKNWGLS